jgi:signal transduction histidine kinase
VAQIDVLSSISKDFSLLAEIRLDALEPTSLKDLLQEVLDLYESASPNVQWVVSQIQDDALVMASHSHLLRVYINLVKNALHAIENVEHPRVEIRCSAQDLGWEVAIIDNGVGIDDLRIKQIFEPRFTLKEGGTGLGLTIVKSVIVQLGGKVSVSSRQGEGSAFRIWLPRI